MYFYLTDLCPANDGKHEQTSWQPLDPSFEVSRLGIKTSEAEQSHQYSWDIREFQIRMLSQSTLGIVFRIDQVHLHQG